MQILVTNDDGIESPGIAALVEVAADLGEVIVVAPSVGVSSCGHHVTTHRDLTVKEIRSGWYSVDGYPADCVRVGLTAIATETSLVLSGINDGGNLGMDLLMSGTASAAREATIRGIPGIALSQYKARRGEVDWKRAISWSSQVLLNITQRKLPAGAFWNINLPDPQVTELQRPDLIECPYDHEPLPVGFEYSEGTWRYASRYQSRSNTPDKDVDLCFRGAITLSAVPAFQ